MTLIAELLVELEVLLAHLLGVLRAQGRTLLAAVWLLGAARLGVSTVGILLRSCMSLSRLQHEALPVMHWRGVVLEESHELRGTLA